MFEGVTPATYAVVGGGKTTAATPLEVGAAPLRARTTIEPATTLRVSLKAPTPARTEVRLDLFHAWRPEVVEPGKALTVPRGHPVRVRVLAPGFRRWERTVTPDGPKLDLAAELEPATR